MTTMAEDFTTALTLSEEARFGLGVQDRHSACHTCDGGG